ncbi:universal stress protein [Pseudonocardia parietis]|uniref:Nucleotide-binding universal stress UspA family protein n=1 Tax=Pseudonocardia parietis TaxID=570936 RepID=A0ABS4VW86_9PSEU|nr:universal stress protein [Pseudonocardia parietis]MBP2368164.1 nucleotide-binding universal stress UspA family protein [Pseudonocardia parietis]
MSASQGWPIVVGVDGSASGMDAVRWAAAWAAEQDRPVRLITAVGPAPYQTLGPEALVRENYREAALRAAEQQIQAAAGAAAQVVAVERIRTEIRNGTPAEVLHDESIRASMLVVGNRGRGGFRGLLLGSTGVALAAAVRCPLVVVRGRPAPDGPVVVGVDGSPDSDAALGFAFETAARWGAPLTAVLAGADPVVDPAVAVVIDRALIEREQRELLAQALTGWLAKFPDVEVRGVVAHGSPAAALIEKTPRARLMVVGSRGRGGLAGLVLGSVSQSLLHHAACPVAVVRASGDHLVEP